MSCLAELLAAVGPDLERQLKPQLSGPFGGLLRGYLPQTWVFVTEEETATLRVGGDGSAHASPGPTEPADVLIETTHARLSVALRTRDKSQVPPGTTRVTPKTEKGRTAFQFVRSRLGI